MFAYIRLGRMELPVHLFFFILAYYYYYYYFTPYILKILTVALFVLIHKWQVFVVFVCGLYSNFTFMLPRIVTDFLLNNQPDAPIIQINSVIKFYMFRASSLPIIRSSILYIRHWQVSCRVFDDRFQAESVPSWLCLEAVIRNLHETYQCRMYSIRLLMMGRQDARNMWNFKTELIWIIGASGWLFKKEILNSV